MTLPEAELKHTALCSEIRKHNHHYYELKQPLISDREYDGLYNELLGLERQFPRLMNPHSPTQRPSSKPKYPTAGTLPRPPFKMPDLSADPSTMSIEELQAHQESFKALHGRDFKQLLQDEANQRSAHTGFIYVLTNRAMPGLVKVGKTSGPVEERVIHLNSPTSVPEPFRIEFIIPVYEDLRAAERKAHAALDLYRQNNKREFFTLPADLARHLLEQALGEKAKPPHGKNGKYPRPAR